LFDRRSCRAGRLDIDKIHKTHRKKLKAAPPR
jgi:hypothetical protein